jgi:hypothetical protein
LTVDRAGLTSDGRDHHGRGRGLSRYGIFHPLSDIRGILRSGLLHRQETATGNAEQKKDRLNPAG